MTNQSTDNPTGWQRRYTVSRLLELAPNFRPTHFDLSKFTYDAARAGVVPPLGACAMSSRRTSSDRPRGWSQESGSSQDEDVILYQGNRASKGPDRHPSVPPTEITAQKDDGFAKFLKKHSSPNHQRVTAGGRIVPMEQQPRPPIFTLPAAKQDSEEQKPNMRSGVNGVTKTALAGHEPAKAGATANNAKPQPATTGFTESSVPGPGANVPASINPFGFDFSAIHANYLQAGSTAPYYTGMPADPYSAMMSPQMYPAGAIPFLGFTGPVGAPFAMPLFANAQMLGFPPSGGIPTSPTDQPLTSAHARRMHADAVARFEELEEQLRAMDRHRAMREHDPYLAQQRLAIVTMRSEVKSAISHWEKYLEPNSQDMSMNSSTGAHSTLNVQASSYVPIRVRQSTETLSDNNPSGLKPNGADSSTGKPDFVVDSTRRPIPIVPPPGKSASLHINVKQEAAPKNHQIEVDDWGIRVGPAPPELQRQQEEVAKALSRQASISPLTSGDNTAMYTPQGSSEVTPPAPPSDVKDLKEFKIQTEYESQTEWLPIKPGRAPPTVEASYELQLDAMRLPTGMIAKIRLPDGIITDVRGCSLKRPPSFEMDEFEQRYWTTKPTLTQEMLDSFLEVRRCDDKDASLEIQALGLERNTEMKENASARLSSHSSHGTMGKDANHAPQLFGADVHEYGSVTEQSTGSDHRLSSLKLSSASSPPIWLRGDDKASWFAHEPARNGRLAGSEALSSKGFSSVSLQNVHAMGRLPHVDGPSDGQRLSAKSMLSAASKAATSQPPACSVSASESFYGPGPVRRAGPAGFTFGNDDVFRAGMSRGEDM